MIIQKRLDILLIIFGILCFGGIYTIFIIYFPCGTMQHIECIIVKVILGGVISVIGTIFTIIIIILLFLLIYNILKCMIGCLSHRSDEDITLLPDSQ